MIKLAGPSGQTVDTSDAASADPPLLSVRGMSKEFGGTHALDDVDLVLNSGEILALLGENGAGKSTLIKILAGIYTPSAGSIAFHGEEITGSPRHLPIAFIHQDLGLIEWMTIAENICLTLGYPRRGGVISWREARRRAMAALDQLGVTLDPELRVERLTRTEKSLVAIARALAADAEVLILDEPTASLPADEVTRLFGVLRLLRDRGIGMIYVSHRLDEVFEIGDRVVVLRDGKVAGSRRVAELTAEEVILLIVGREPSQIFRRPAERSGSPLLTLDAVMVNEVGPINCAVHAGEIVGLVGLRDAGQDSVGRALFGLEPIAGGSVTLECKPVAAGSPKQAMASGINLICADRITDSVLPTLNVRENFFVNPIMAGLRHLSMISARQERHAAVELGQRVGLRPNDPTLPIELLSGGNQQKVVVGRWLNLHGKVYIFEDPTAGVDVGAKAEIYRLFDVALQAGACILIASTDFEEVAKVCHRALVFDRGRVVAELRAGDLSVENLLAAASASIESAGAAPARIFGESHAIN